MIRAKILTEFGEVGRWVVSGIFATATTVGFITAAEYQSADLTANEVATSVKISAPPRVRLSISSFAKPETFIPEQNNVSTVSPSTSPDLTPPVASAQQRQLVKQNKSPPSHPHSEALKETLGETLHPLMTEATINPATNSEPKPEPKSEFPVAKPVQLSKPENDKPAVAISSRARAKPTAPPKVAKTPQRRPLPAKIESLRTATDGAVPQDKSGGLSAATPLHRPRPVYPRHAKRAGLEGWVEVRFTVAETGDVTRPVVVSASPVNVFESEVLKSMTKWKYRPAMFVGVPTAQPDVSLVIEFKLLD